MSGLDGWNGQILHREPELAGAPAGLDDTGPQPAPARLAAIGTSNAAAATDFPYRTAADHAKGVTAFFKGDELKKVERDNALKLAPRLKSA
jgi:6-methylsalicylate decarboxylase